MSMNEIKHYKQIVEEENGYYFFQGASVRNKRKCNSQGWLLLEDIWLELPIINHVARGMVSDAVVYPSFWDYLALVNRFIEEN